MRAAQRGLSRHDALAAGTYLGPDLIIRGRLGEGGTGSVYLAYHQVLKREVAVKICDRSGPERAALEERLIQEARMCASVRDARVPRIYGLDKLEDGAHYLVMERVEGEPLADLLARGPIRARVACELGIELLKALEAVHRAQIIHRDVKPSNIMIGPDSQEGPRLRLLDFGIGKAMSSAVQDSDPSLTRPGEIVGTPMYMSPEQMLEGKVDQRADIYAAGVVLFEMLAGRPPFCAPSVAAMFVAVLHDVMPNLGELRPDLPPELVALVHKAASRNIDDRFESAREMRVLLERACALLPAQPEPTRELFASPSSDQLPTVRWKYDRRQPSDGRRRARLLPMSLALTLKPARSGPRSSLVGWAKAGFLTRRAPVSCTS